MGEFIYQLDKAVSYYQNWLRCLRKEYDFTSEEFDELSYEDRRDIANEVNATLSELGTDIRGIQNHCKELTYHIQQCSDNIYQLEKEIGRIRYGNFAENDKLFALGKLERQKRDIEVSRSNAQRDCQQADWALDQLNSIYTVVQKFVQKLTRR